MGWVVWEERGGGGGGGGVEGLERGKLNGRFRPKVQTLIHLHTIFLTER